VVEALAVASAVHALFTVRTAQGTITGVIGLITFQWLGLPLYWFFGSRRFDSHSRVMKQALVTHQEKIHEVRAEMRPFLVGRPEIQPTGVGDLTAVAGEPFLLENQLDLLIDGKATFEAIFDEVAKANAVFLCNSTSCGRMGSGCVFWKPWRPARRTASRFAFSLTG
jgi:cardiolipin synthase